MKKILIFLFLIVLFICIFGIFLLSNKKTINLNIKQLLSVNLSDIISVRMREETEGGYVYYKTEDTAVIQEIYNAINNIRIGREADINVSDDARDYIFDLNNGTKQTFSFHSNFYYANYNTYETDNYKALKIIEIPRIESWE